MRCCHQAMELLRYERDRRQRRRREVREYVRKDLCLIQHHRIEVASRSLVPFGKLARSDFSVPDHLPLATTLNPGPSCFFFDKGVNAFSYAAILSAGDLVFGGDSPLNRRGGVSLPGVMPEAPGSTASASLLMCRETPRSPPPERRRGAL